MNGYTLNLWAIIVEEELLVFGQLRHTIDGDENRVICSKMWRGDTLQHFR